MTTVTSARYILGLWFIFCVSVIWAGASILVQFIYTKTNFNSPFLLTYIGTSLFIILLPIHYIKQKLARCCNSDDNKDRHHEYQTIDGNSEGDLDFEDELNVTAATTATTASNDEDRIGSSSPYKDDPSSDDHHVTDEDDLQDTSSQDNHVDDNEEEEEEEDKSAKMGRCCRSWKVENSQRKDTDAARRGPTRYGSPGHLRVDDCHGKEAGEDHIPRKWALLALGMVGWDRSFHGDDEGLMLVAHT